MNNDFLENLAFESGAVEPESPTNADLVEVLAEDAAAPAPGVVETLDTAEATADIAEQLEELAERAEAVAEKAAEEEKEQGGVSEVSVVSTESMHREFATIMRANKLNLPATSFESAGSDKERLVGLARDCRRVAEINRGLRAQMLDYSSEGAIMRFLRSDESRLEKARGALITATTRLKSDFGDLKSSPVMIKNQGLARFMTREGVPVRDLVRAIQAESGYLGKVHDAAVAAAQALSAAADQLAAGKFALDEHKLATMKLAGGLNELGSPIGFMMGNHTLRAEITAGPLAGLTAPKFSRVGETQVRGKDIAWGLFGGFVGGLQANAVSGLLILGGMALGAAPLFVAAGAVQAAKKPWMIINGVKTYFNSADSSELRSQASANDLLNAIQQVLGYERYVTYKLDAETIQAKIKAARGATAGLDAEQKKAVSKVCEALETSLSRLVRLADCVYEQALYTTTMMATLVDSAVNKVK
jgi:hypothetical protein